MVAKKILENWLYWIVLDSLAMCLYFNKALFVTTGLFAAFVILASLGFFRWLKTYNNQTSIGDTPQMGAAVLGEGT